MPVLEYIELAQVCSCFVLDESFEPRLILSYFVGLTRHTQKMC